jgi:hypothetical protein
MLGLEVGFSFINDPDMGIIIPCDDALKVKVMGFIQLY